MIPADIFVEISILLAIAAAVSMLVCVLKQPPIIGYIITGILVGSAALGLIKTPETIEVLGKFGIALLLFIVGLGLNPKTIRGLGKISFVTGVGQVVFTVVIGIPIVLALGFDIVSALYLSIALALSSTIVVVKLLSDKKEQNQLHGRITVGFLLVQDIIATFALLLVAASAKGALTVGGLALLVGEIVLITAILFGVVYAVVRPATKFLSKSSELLFVFALAWGLGVGALFYKAGFSLEVGALLGGVALAAMPYAPDVAAKLRPLRDFFIIVFFISLGAGFDLTQMGGQWTSVAILSLFVLIVNPLVVLVLMGLLGYTKKTSFKTCLAVAQISEFSLILLLVGQSNGQIPSSVVGLATLVALITFAASSYMIVYSDNLYAWFERYLSLFERRKVKYGQDYGRQYDAIILGYRKGGAEFAKILSKLKKRLVVVDYDPEVIDELERCGRDYLYGDATDPELLDEVNIDKARVIVITITDPGVADVLLTRLRAAKSQALVICTAQTTDEAAHLYEMGASYVMVPHTIGSEHLSSFLSEHGFRKADFERYRKQHIEYIASYSREREQPSG